jgi:signal transduction histidine kinase
MQEGGCIVVRCSKDGAIHKVVRNDFEQILPLRSGVHLNHALKLDSYPDIERFFTRIHTTQSVLSLEISKSNNSDLKPFHLMGGVSSDDNVIVVGGYVAQDLNSIFYEEMASINNELINMLRQANEPKLDVESVNKQDIPHLVDEVARINGILLATERQLAEKNERLEKEIRKRFDAEEKMRIAYSEMESFSYTVSHDLKAPLRHIKSFCKELKQHHQMLSKDEISELLDIIFVSSDKMTDLVQDLLIFAKSQRNELHLDSINLSDIANSIVDDLLLVAQGREVNFIIEPELECVADFSLLKIVLQNLFNNAFKYTSRTEKAEITFGCSHKEKGKWFFIKDNGVGFDPDKTKDLFKPFHRLHSDEEFKGTGIGLATVKRIIERHGGQIWAENNSGAGACFYFSLTESAAI